jgi:thiol-disulfide isomerase/thioredoxin
MNLPKVGAFVPMLIMFLLGAKTSFASRFDTTCLYHAEIQLNDRLSLPFVIAYEGGLLPKLTVVNGTENISMEFRKAVSDTLYFDFPQIAGSLVFCSLTHRGYWLNLNKAKPLQYPFTFYKTSKSNLRFDADSSANPSNFSGKYAVRFTDGNNNGEDAIGLFQQTGSLVTGTFRTETGDYRYLEGMVQKDRLRMSCFDGIHAYYFEGILKVDLQIKGDFYSGSQYHATWTGIKNDTVVLRSPYEISYALVPYTPLCIAVKTPSGRKKTLSASYFKGQPTVVQIMGTWCPNCLDETNYLKTLFENPTFANIRWVTIAFEYGATDAEKIRRFQSFRRKSNLQHAFFLGGEARSKDASSVFNQLNGVYGFPTTLYLDKKGRIVSVHSGFDGPATQNHFEAYKEKTENLLRELMAKPE